MLNKKRHEYTQLKTAMENDIMERFPNMARHVDSIHIEKSSEVPIRRDVREGAIFGNMDSNISTHFGTKAPKFDLVKTVVSDELKSYIDTNMDSLTKAGMSAEQAKRKVADSIQMYAGFDEATKQYVVMGVPPTVQGKATDSLLQQTSIPMWNVSVINKVFKQPFVDSHAKRLVSVEASGSNPWADVLIMFKESFEGWGKISSTAKGNIKQNNSNPVTNEMGQIVTEVYNISVDYETDVMEEIKAKAPGNILTNTAIADREKYAGQILDRMQDLLIYFGSKEAGIDGLMDVANVEVYTGTPLWDLYVSDDPTSGADIVAAINRLIGDFLRENNYMPAELKINVSPRTFQALTQKMFNKTYNPSSPMTVISNTFKGTSQLDGGLVQCSYSIVADKMCDANTLFNPTDYDLTFITVPKITDSLNGTQDSLVVVPELIKNWIVPALPQRTGMLYTNYRRIGGVIAPVEGTVKVIRGFGYQGK